MSINVETRRKHLEDLKQFIGDAELKLQSVLDCLGWKENTIKEEKMVTCSVNKNHRVPIESLEEHHKKCKLKSLKYDLKETFLSEPIHDPKSSIKISNQEKTVILTKASCSIPNFKKRWNGVDEDPQTSDRLLSTFSADERLALYDYTRSVTTGPDKPSEFNVFDDEKPDNKELTYEELLEQERNAKRRRIKYKTVHTSKKNHTEVLRDVISNQMELFQSWVLEKESVESGSKSIDYEEKVKVDVNERNSKAYHTWDAEKESVKSGSKFLDYDEKVNERNSKRYHNWDSEKESVKSSSKSYDYEDRIKRKHLSDNKRRDDCDRNRRRSRERDRSRRRSPGDYKSHRRSTGSDKRYKYDDYRERRYK